MVDPIGIYSLAIYIISYVDDNTLVEKFQQDQSLFSILAELQHCINRWHNILQITGGDLALEKYTFFIIKWRWKDGVATLVTPESDPGNLIVSGTKIIRLRPDKGTRVLGVRMAMDGTFDNSYCFVRVVILLILISWFSLWTFIGVMSFPVTKTAGYC
jgi:hypothetical protein